MIEVCSPLEVQADPEGGWHLTFWVSDLFNYTTPLRSMLADITLALEQDAQTHLQLPVYEANEDFIEGTLRFGAVTLRIYYEHALSYLTLVSDDEATLRDVAHRIRPHIVVVP